MRDPHILELSVTQRGFLFAELRHPGSCNIAIEFHINGDLDPLAVRNGINSLTRQHDAFRLVIDRRGVRQRLLESVDMERVFEYLDHREAGPELTDADELFRYHAAPFPLGSPYLRARLVRLPGVTQFLLQITTNHLVFDGASIPTLSRELIEFVGAAARGEVPDGKSPGSRFSDYVRSESRQLRTDASRAHRAFWRAELSGMSVLSMPSLDRADESALRHGDHGFVLVSPSGTAAARCAGLGREARATPFMVSVAAFAMALHRVCGWDEVAFHLPTANRTEPELWAAIGAFATMVVLRLPCGHDLPTIIEETKRRLGAALAHQNLPYPELLKALAPRDRQVLVPGGRNPLVGISELPSPPGAAEHAGAEWRPSTRELSRAQGTYGVGYDLFLDSQTAAGQVTWRVSYAAGVAPVARAVADEMISCFEW